MGGVSKGLQPEGWPRILFRLAGNASLSEEALLQRPKMSTKHRDFIPARTSPGNTRPVLAARTQGRSVKSAMGGTVSLRVGSVNVGTMRGHEGEVVEMAASRCETLERMNHGAESSCGKIRGEFDIRVCTTDRERQGRKRGILPLF